MIYLCIKFIREFKKPLGLEALRGACFLQLQTEPFSQKRINGDERFPNFSNGNSLI